jgi:hypothetical protein
MMNNASIKIVGAYSFVPNAKSPASPNPGTI